MDPSRMIEGILELTSGVRRQYQTYVKVRGCWAYLYRAIDKRGDTVGVHLSLTRNAKAAKRFGLLLTQRAAELLKGASWTGCRPASSRVLEGV